MERSARSGVRCARNDRRGGKLARPVEARLR